MKLSELCCGSRLLTDVVDCNAIEFPNKIHSYIQRSGNLQGKFKPVTYKQLANAVNRAAHWLQDEGLSSAQVAFLGCSDLRSIIFYLAAIKTKTTLLLLNCYTPEHEILRLIDQNACGKLLYAEEAFAHVPTGSQAVAIPALQALLDGAVEHPHVNSLYETVEREVVAIVLTSGSTGTPKGVPVTHGRISALDMIHATSPHHGRSVLPITASEGSRLKYVALDLAYMGGIDAGIVCPIFEDSPIVLGPPSIIPHELRATEFCEIVRQTGCDSFLAYPNVVERLLADPSASEVLLQLRNVGYIGGPLNQKVAQLITSRTRLTPYIGSTEAGSFTCHQLPSSLTGYLCLNSRAMGLEWTDAGDDLFEPVFRRNPALAKTQGVFHSFPALDEWRTRDLYSKHPSEPDVWRYEGRKDDVVILNHGENISPTQLEHGIRSVPGAKDALLLGNQRPALAVLLQLSEECTADPARKRETLERVWSAIQALNAGVGALAQIQKHRVLVAEGDRPFVRTRKGAVSRRRTLQLYAAEIDRLYLEVPAATS